MKFEEPILRNGDFMVFFSVFPADAGMIPNCKPCRFGGGGVPRGCGDDPCNADHDDCTEECSPRMRG